MAAAAAAGAYSHRGLIREVATRLGLECTVVSDGAITLVTKDTVTKIFMLCRCPLNNASSASSCADKAATSAILKTLKIPHIRHRLFVNPEKSPSPEGVWRDLLTYADKHGSDVVCKPKEGSAGVDVMHTTTRKALEVAVGTLFSAKLDVTLSAYKRVKNEYRVLVLDQRPEVVFRKGRSFIEGDGEHTIAELLAHLAATLSPRQADLLKRDLPASLALSVEVLLKGERRDLTWKDDLGPGSSCELIGGIIVDELDGKSAVHEAVPHLVDLALKAAAALDIRSSAVDIVELEGEPKKDKVWRVMEINSAPTLTPLLRQSAMARLAANRLMEKIVRAVFGL